MVSVFFNHKFNTLAAVVSYEKFFLNLASFLHFVFCEDKGKPVSYCVMNIILNVEKLDKIIEWCYICAK